MKKNVRTESQHYVAPQLKVIEIDETYLICTSGEEEIDVQENEDYVFENNPDWF